MIPSVLLEFELFVLAMHLLGQVRLGTITLHVIRNCNLT